MSPVRAGAAFLLLAFATGGVHAEPSSALDRVGFSLGGYRADTRMRLQASGDFDDRARASLQLPGGRETLGRARLEFLVGDTQGLEFDYFSFRRSRDQVLQRAFDVGDTRFHLGARLRGSVDLDFGSAAWRWWFGDGSTVFGLGVGAAYYRLKVGLSADVAANDEAVHVAERYDADAVAPMLALGWRHAPNPNWRFYADATGVRKNGGRLSGHAWNAAAGVEWFPFANAGIGIEYALTRIRLQRDASRYDADLDLRLHGPAAYLRLRF